MSVIVNAIIAMKPKIDFIAKVANDIDTSTLQSVLEAKVYNYFLAFKPLSHKLVDVCNIDSDKILYIKNFIKIRSYFSRYGYSVGCRDFFELIIKFGDKIGEKVRKTIKEDFIKMVELTKKLKPYSEVFVEKNVAKNEVIYNGDNIIIPKTVYDYDIFNGVTIEELKVVKISLKTNNPYAIYLHLINGRNRSFTISGNNITEIESLIDELVEIYKEAQTAVSSTINHNETIFAEMDKVVSPYLVSQSLKT